MPGRTRSVASKDYDTFEAVQSRLDEIVEAVGDESLPLDDALALYEEAVNLGLRGSDLLEENIEAFDAQQAAEAVEGDRRADASADVEPDAAEGRSDDSSAQESAGADASPLANEIR